MAFDFNSLDHAFFMREAIKEAELAMQTGERPIGAVIVHHGKIVGRGKAEHLEKHSRLAHAELNALLATASSLYDYPHDNGVIYTTLEPCEMCLGAIVMSDVVNHVVFSLADNWINPKPMFEIPHVRRHIYNYIGGILEEESATLWEKCRPDELLLIREGHK
ncbi:MAG: nucleoside deaminase [Chloroflexota bacterium]